MLRSGLQSDVEARVCKHGIHKVLHVAGFGVTIIIIMRQNPNIELMS